MLKITLTIFKVIGLNLSGVCACHLRSVSPTLLNAQNRDAGN